MSSEQRTEKLKKKKIQNEIETFDIVNLDIIKLLAYMNLYKKNKMECEMEAKRERKRTILIFQYQKKTKFRIYIFVYIFFFIELI